MKIKLKEVRTEKKVSLRKLSNESGVHKSHIIKIESENTNPSIVVICKLAKALGVTLDELIDID